MKVLERAAGHASGPYVVPNIDVEAIAVHAPTTPVCGAFRGFRRQPGPVRHGRVIDRLAEKVGYLRLGDAQPQRDRTGRGVGSGPDHGRRHCGGARACVSTRFERALRRRLATAGQGRRVWDSASRTPASATASTRSCARWCASEDDGKVEVRHCWTEMGQGVHTVALQVAVEELGVEPERVRGARRHQPRTRHRTDHRQPGHVDGSRRGGRRLPSRDGRWLPDRHRLRRRVRRQLDQFAVGGSRESGHSLDLRLRSPGGGPRSRVRFGGSGHGRPRCRPRGESPALRGPDRGRGPHGPGLCADRGFPRRRDRAPAER